MKCLSSSALKIIAMVCMLCDHMWATVIPGSTWLTMVGRLAFPIFAFQIAEGASRTFNIRAYTKRLFWFAILSEVPFNLMCSGMPIWPLHQNVLFTFWISVLILRQLKKAKEEHDALRYILTAVIFAVVGYLVGTVFLVDYYGYGILMVILFYVTRDLPYGWAAQLAGMVYINCHMMGGQTIPFSLGGMNWEFPIQALAVLALIPIWLYSGEKGKSYKMVRPMCYAFYPLHILILALVGIFVLN